MADNAEEMVEDWNRQHEPGTEVSLTNDFGKVEHTRTRSVAWVVCGQPVVNVEGRSGGYLLTRISAVDQGGGE